MLKSHYPCVPKLEKGDVNGSCVILSIRNPFDQVVSFITLILAKVHWIRIKNDLKTEFPAQWDHIVKYYTKQYVEFYTYYLTLLKTT